MEEFKEFVEEDREYVKNMQLYKSYLEIIESINKQKGIIINEICRLNKDKDNVKEQRIRLENELNSRKDSLKVYEDAQEGKVIVDEIDNMEERLRALKANITFNLGQLEADKKSKQDDLQNSQDTLASYNLDEEEYLDKIFDQERLRVIQDMVKELKRDEERSANNCRDVDRKLQNARGRLESKEEEIKRLGEEPLESSLIKLNFNMRRKEENETMISAKNKINELIRVSRDYSGIVNRIEIQVDIKGYEVQIDYKIKKSVYEDYEEQTNELKCLQEENRKYEKNASSYYYKLKANYKDKNIHIQNIFIGLEPLIEGARTDRNKYYYLGERILDNNDSLNKLISVCEQRLSNLEKNKNDMVQHSYLQAKQVYEEIQKIAENSSIKLEGKSRPIPMLKIDMVPLDETEEENRVKMKGYIENCVSIIKEDMKQEKKAEEIRKKISKYMSTKELLNVLSDLGKMRVLAYKIDINIKNSGYKTWEQVMKENSGGERFVSFFAVIVALMSYTRTSTRFEDDYQRNKDTKTLIMDNPFGPISSEHLLKPLFRIADKYNTQLICLTDLKQNSILNCFNLIYMIKIRQNVFGTNEYLKLEKQIKEGAVMENDELLEKAVFNVKEIEQISLF